MKKLRKALGVLIAAVLLAAVLTPAASARLYITGFRNGPQRATAATMTNGQSNIVVARVRVIHPDGSYLGYWDSLPTRTHAMTRWDNVWAPARSCHRGFIL